MYHIAADQYVNVWNETVWG